MTFLMVVALFTLVYVAWQIWRDIRRIADGEPEEVVPDPIGYSSREERLRTLLGKARNIILFESENIDEKYSPAKLREIAMEIEHALRS